MKALRLFGHPVHPMLTHLPIGLLATSPLWDALGLVLGGATWWAVAFWVRVAGVASSLPAAAAGLVDFAALPDGHRSAERASRHMMLMMASVCAYGVDLALRGGASQPMGAARIAAPVCGLIGLALLSAGGWYGGDLVYRDGLGVERPAAETARTAGETRA